MGHQPSFACEDCGQDVPVVHPGRARAVVCAACGAQHDLFAAGSPVIDHIPLRLHRPEGLLELGSKGTFGSSVVQVIGRIRMSYMVRGRVRMWDEWVLITSDGRYLRIRESEGNYEILIPKEPSGPFDQDLFDAARRSEHLQFDGRHQRVVTMQQAKVLFVEGELTSRICLGDLIEVCELESDEGMTVVEGTYDDLWCFSVEPVEDRAMWALFGYDGILEAHDALVNGKARNAFLARGVAQAASVLFAFAALGGMLLVGVLTAHVDVGEGWARFDYSVQDRVIEEYTGVVPLRSRWGFYTLDVTCGLDVDSEGIELIAEAPDGTRHTLVRCMQEGMTATNRQASHSFRVQTEGAWRMLAIHRAEPGGDGRASLSWQLGWDLGSAWWPIGGLFTLVLFGIVSLMAYPLARIMGLSRLERDFEDRRAELALHLRRRFAVEDAEDEPSAGPGDLPPPPPTAGGVA